MDEEEDTPINRSEEFVRRNVNSYFPSLYNMSFPKGKRFSAGNVEQLKSCKRCNQQTLVDYRRKYCDECQYWVSRENRLKSCKKMWLKKHPKK